MKDESDEVWRRGWIGGRMNRREGARKRERKDERLTEGITRWWKKKVVKGDILRHRQERHFDIHGGGARIGRKIRRL